MNSRIAISFDNGEVAVMELVSMGRSPTLPYGAVWLATKPGYWEREPTDANIFAEASKAFPHRTITSYKVIDPATIPADRTYRDGWTWRGGKIDHDIVKCRSIHRDCLRAWRKPRLEQLDADYMKALETNDAAELARIAAKKQALRDAPADPRIDAAQTVEELKTVRLPE